jgi:hypothetical protein
VRIFEDAGFQPVWAPAHMAVNRQKEKKLRLSKRFNSKQALIIAAI